jgi:L-malate glycosyltransferase
MRKIRVLIFVDSFRLGGSERQGVELAKRLSRREFEPSVVCFTKEGPLIKELPTDISEVESFPLNGFRSAGTLHQAARLYQYLRRRRIDVLQCFDFYSNLFAIPIARLARVPVVLAARREEGVTKTNNQRLAQQLVYRLATGVVANAEALKEQVLQNNGLSKRKVWVVHNGLDTQRFTDVEHSSKSEDVNRSTGITIAVIANLRPEKGHSMFLQAAKLLIEKGRMAHFIIAGDGSMKNEIKSQIAGMSLGKQVEMVGAIGDIPAFLKSIDIAVLPSLRNEGFPNSIMEAMASSLPVVASDSGGTRELVIDGETGFIVEPGVPEGLADRLGKLCDDRELRIKMGEAGRFRVMSHFTADKMAEKFGALYRRLVVL